MSIASLRLPNHKVRPLSALSGGCLRTREFARSWPRIDYCAAADLDARLLIAGTPDPANPASVTEAEAKSWNNEPGVSWLGHVGDIAGLWAHAHVAVLPSRREGLPLSLMEAAACGRAMIATDVPGCREIVIHDQTGLLVPVDDAPALAAAMARLAGSPDLRARYAAAARKLVVEKLSAEIIGKNTVQFYRRLLRT